MFRVQAVVPRQHVADGYGKSHVQERPGSEQLDSQMCIRDRTQLAIALVIGLLYFLQLPQQIFSVGPVSYTHLVEEAGRAVRYAFLEEEAGRLEREGGGAVKIATAHTLSDSMETALLSMTRGCGPERCV